MENKGEKLRKFKDWSTKFRIQVRRVSEKKESNKGWVGTDWGGDLNPPQKMGCPAAKTHQVLTGAHNHRPSRHWRQKRRHRLSETENDREEKSRNQMGRLALCSFLITAVNHKHKSSS